MSELLPHLEYKDSGIEWLPKIPKHWQKNKVSRISSLTVGWTPPTGDASSFEGDNLWANISDLGPRVISDTSKRISDEAVSASRITKSPKGSLLFSFKLSVGQVSFAACDMYTNEAIATFLETSEVALTYAYYAFPVFIVENASENIYGAKILNQSLIGGARIALPPVAEQHAIAAYLDHETAEIDAFIGDQEELINLLTERRSATITQAVTKGLDFAVEMTDSGTEWLGKVPAAWRTASLRHLLASKLKYGANEAAEFDNPEWVRYLRITDFGYDGKLKDETFKSLPPDIAADYMVKPMDILLARSGATVGKAFMVPEDNPPSCFAGYLIRVECDPKVLLPRFAYRYFQSTPFVDWKNASQTVATIQNIGADKYATLPVPVPPIAEQQAIADYLDYEIAEIDAAIADADEAIELSKERRAALISAAVTGKIDVRNHIIAELGAA